MTAKSLNCWYRALSKEDDILLRDLNLFNICRMLKRQHEEERKRKSETQSHKKLCSEWNLQTKNFLSSPNVIQNIFVRDLNILDFRVFKAAGMSFTVSSPTDNRFPMHKSLIFILLPPPPPSTSSLRECKCKYLFRWWEDISVADDVDDFLLRCLTMCAGMLLANKNQILYEAVVFIEWRGEHFLVFVVFKREWRRKAAKIVTSKKSKSQEST